MLILADEHGILRYEDGSKVNTRDYLLTKPYIKRYYDYNTKNQSAINLYVLLKKLGVKNCNEHLQIFNPQLIGVDPWDPLLKDNVKLQIIQECMHNYWYVYREILKVNNGLDPFDLNIFNYTAIYFMLRNINFFLEASRQLGKTQVISTHSGIEHNFGRNINMASTHYDAAMGAKNLNKIEAIIQTFPSWMQFFNKSVGKTDKKTGLSEIKSKAKSAGKKQSMKNEMFNNLIELFVIGQQESKADNAGRGGTIPCWFMDELAATKHNKIAFESLNQTTKEAKAIAKKDDRPFGYRLLGTPGKLDTPEGQWMQENLLSRYIPMNENSLEVLDMTEDEIREYAKQRSIDQIFHIKYEFDIIGKDADWFSDRCEGQSVDGIRRELLLIWEDVSSASPFPATELATLTTYAEKKEKKSYSLNMDIAGLTNEVFIDIYPQGDELYSDWIDFFTYNYREGIVVGVDVSRGLGGPNDSTVYSFVDVNTGVLVGLIKNNTLEMNDLVLLTKGLCEIAIKNGIKMALAIERNDGTSTALIQSLKYMPHIQPFLIPFPAAEWKLNNAFDTNVDYEYLDEYGQSQKSDFGFAMNGAARDKIIALIQLLVRKYTRCIAVTDLVDEIKTLVVYSKKNVNGGTTTKIAAAPGKHDDIVMSVGHAYNAMYYYASILKRRHGIIVDVKKWLINENRTAFSFSNRPPSARITVTFKEVEGVMQEIFYDNKYNKVLTEEEVDQILSEENPTDKYVSDAHYKPKEEVKIVDEMYERSVERFKQIGSNNIKVVSNEDYDLYKNGLAESNNIYDDNCVNMMNEMLSLAEQKF
jgi:PHIKZ025